MVNPQTTVVDNKFIGGLKTEFTGINFPDDSCTETFDCIFSRTGLVSRRLGFDYETNYAVENIDRTNKAIATYLWKNVAGDGEVSLVASQIGGTVYFYRISSATVASPTSHQRLASTVVLSSYLAQGATSVDTSVECQFTEGNGYLFVFHKDIEPVYISYSAGILTTTPIAIKIRDFEGVPGDSTSDTFRPSSLSAIHQYNLQNQGWTSEGYATSAWSATSSTSNTTALGNHTWTVESGLTIVAAQPVTILFIFSGNGYYASGSVVSYAGTTLIVSIDSSPFGGGHAVTSTEWYFSSPGTTADSRIIKWHTDVGNYPSNSDIWWLFKNTSNVFAPATTVANITLNSGPAPKGYYILDAFVQNRTQVSNITIANAVSGGIRPATGTWFAGRVWFADVNYAGFNEKIYFSQIIESVAQLGKCYQINDPTSESRADLLASDGGVIVIQGSGQVFKLFPIVNGLLVFAERGVWFITGSQGIGFTANDYTITKISHVPTLSASSFVDVLGIPMWCNEDGIYTITSGQQGAAAQYQGLSVTPITYGTIASFYQDIPLISKRYIKGYYSLLDYKVQWLYRTTSEITVTDRYSFSNILNLDTVTNAFYPWTIPGTNTRINSIIAFGGNGTTNTLPYKFRYLTSTGGGTAYDFTFSETNNTSYRDWATPNYGFNITDYTSYFVTGYRVYTKANTLGQLPYVDVHSVGDISSKSYLSSRWDYATAGTTGRWSQPQLLEFPDPNRAYQTVRRRIRGQGRAVQLKFSSYSGSPMSLIGWSTWVTVNPLP